LPPDEAEDASNQLNMLAKAALNVPSGGDAEDLVFGRAGVGSDSAIASECPPSPVTTSECLVSTSKC